MVNPPPPNVILFVPTNIPAYVAVTPIELTLAVSPFANPLNTRKPKPATAFELLNGFVILKPLIVNVFTTYT
ncbi:MAG: hypothetical protein FWD47_01195 [Treponema sp.]|nr:hypothetical protein [Treponema sp.]